MKILIFKSFKADNFKHIEQFFVMYFQLTIFGLVRYYAMFVLVLQYVPPLPLWSTPLSMYELICNVFSSHAI